MQVEMDEIIKEIKKLKEDRNAVILSHNYQMPEIQDIADYVGDSLGLARKGAESKADVIVMCGVKFMAETASILSPDRDVLMPDADAGCPMANMITAANIAFSVVIYNYRDYRMKKNTLLYFQHSLDGTGSLSADILGNLYLSLHVLQAGQ